jgi:elongation factor Ts
MSITPAQVKELRDKTGAGMMDCKKALGESNGSMEEAVELLRKWGLSTAAKKSGRSAAEGTIGWHIDNGNTLGLMVEVNCETDFVVKTEDFQGYVKNLVAIIKETNPENLDDLLKQPFDGDTVQEAQTNLVAKIGENLGVRRFVRWEADGSSKKLALYIHAGNKIGTMVRFDDPANKLENQLAREVAMHVAAMHPHYVRKDEIPQDYQEKEKEIMLAQMEELKGKPPEVMDKILAGKLAKHFNEICLDNQIFVRDPEGKSTVGQMLSKVDKDLRVDSFVRFQVGEGIEKKKD